MMKQQIIDILKKYLTSPEYFYYDQGMYPKWDTKDSLLYRMASEIEDMIKGENHINCKKVDCTRSMDGKHHPDGTDPTDGTFCRICGKEYQP